MHNIFLDFSYLSFVFFIYILVLDEWWYWNTILHRLHVHLHTIELWKKRPCKHIHLQVFHTSPWTWNRLLTKQTNTNQHKPTQDPYSGTRKCSPFNPQSKLQLKTMRWDESDGMIEYLLVHIHVHWLNETICKWMKHELYISYLWK